MYYTFVSGISQVSREITKTFLEDQFRLSSRLSSLCYERSFGALFDIPSVCHTSCCNPVFSILRLGFRVTLAFPETSQLKNGVVS